MIGCLFVALFLSLNIAEAKDWSKGKDEFKFVPGKINFYNRSACAKRANLPATSVFAIVDNVNIAKSIYRLAKVRGVDPKTFTDLGIQKFRYSLTSMSQLVATKILNGSLPLISLEKDKIPEDLKGYLASCQNEQCAQLYHYLEEQWLKSKSTVGPVSSLECKVVKKFSTFNSNLNVSRPDKTLLEEMSLDLQHSEDFMESCNDFSKITSPEVALYQFDIKEDETKFQAMGFDFWNTFKIYLSWAFRSAPEMKSMAQPFDFLFSSVNLEEMVLLFANGCESIRPKECSQKDLTLNNLRFLTQDSDAIEWNNYDSIKPVPDREPNNLFAKPIPLTENDLLNLGNSASSDEWLTNFRGNYVRSRGYNKVKFTKATNTLKLIVNSLPSHSILNRLTQDIEKLQGDQKQYLYYLCAEFSIATHEQLSSVREDLWRLKDLKLMQDMVRDLSQDELTTYWNHFESLATGVNGLCKRLKQREVWDDEFELKKDGFSSWYQQLAYESKYSFGDNTALGYPQVERPYLSLQTGETICADGIHCARQVLDAMMSLSAVSFSLSGLVPDEGGIVSNNMANPYVDHYACGAYDPWAKRNKIIFDFLQDMVQAAVWGFLPTPVYVAASLDPKRVVSFDTLVKEGQVYYDPNFNTHRLKLSVIADLGPLIGVPCAVSISGSRLNPFQYYQFNGISVGSCHERTRQTVTVGGPNDMQTEEHYRQVCATCAINLQTVSAGVSMINPWLRVGFFLVKGVVRLAQQMKDPNDLGKDWSVDLQQVALSYREAGKIDKKCSKDLIRGDSCLKDCEAKALGDLTKKYKLSPVSSDFSCVTRRGTFTAKECSSPIEVSFHPLKNDKFEFETNCKLQERK